LPRPGQPQGLTSRKKRKKKKKKARPRLNSDGVLNGMYGGGCVKARQATKGREKNRMKGLKVWGETDTCLALPSEIEPRGEEPERVTYKLEKTRGGNELGTGRRTTHSPAGNKKSGEGRPTIKNERTHGNVCANSERKVFGFMPWGGGPKRSWKMLISEKKRTKN